MIVRRRRFCKIRKELQLHLLNAITLALLILIHCLVHSYINYFVWDYPLYEATKMTGVMEVTGAMSPH